MYPELDASHGCRLAYLDKGRAVGCANGIDAYGGRPGLIQGSTVGTKTGVYEFGIVLFRIQLLEGLGLQLITNRSWLCCHLNLQMKLTQ